MRNGVARSMAAETPATIASPGGEPERSALKGKVLYGDGDRLSLKLAERDRDRIHGSRLCAIFLQTIRVAFDVPEFQRI